MLRYQCLVLDHDDTVMDSTAHVHYPAFLEAMKVMRPGVWMTLDDYFRMNFDPGFHDFCEHDLNFTQEDFDAELHMWQSYVDTHIPKVYPGMASIIRRQKAEGGFVCVASHSIDKNILRDYRANDLPEPDLIFGWELPLELRKPAPYSLETIMERLSLTPKDLLMVDDLKPGYDMARACGVRFAAACWAYDVPQIKSFMRENSDLLFETPEALEDWLFGTEERSDR